MQVDWNDKIAALIAFALLALVIVVAVLAQPDMAFADDEYMTGIDFRSFVENRNADNSQLILGEGSYLLQSILTFILLPIAVIVVIAKTLVAAILTIMGVPFGKILGAGFQTTTYRSNGPTTSRSGVESSQEFPLYLKWALGNMVKGLIVVFCVWGILELLMFGVYVFIDMAKNFG